MRKWTTGWRVVVLAIGIVIAMLVVFCGSVFLYLRALYAPRHIETMDLIEERTGWFFPPETRIVTAGQDNLGMDFAIWAVLEVPRDRVRDVLLAEGQYELSHEKGTGAAPDLSHTYRSGYWSFGPEWIPPLPQRFEHYLAVYRGEARGDPLSVREASPNWGTVTARLVHGVWLPAECLPRQTKLFRLVEHARVATIQYG